jgi:hypothetical protein
MRQDFAYLYDAQKGESVQGDGKGLLNAVNDRVVEPDATDITAYSLPRLSLGIAVP